MPNFLDILGGLAQSGAGGATGALQGSVEGETLKRKFASQDITNQLHVLDMMVKQRLATQPKYEFHNGQMIAIPPAGGPPVLTPMPQAPLNPLQAAQQAAAEARATKDTALAGQVGVAKPPAPNVHWERDDKGNLTRIITRINPDGTVSDERHTLPGVGVTAPPTAVAPNASLIPRGGTTPTYTAPPAPVSKIESFTDEKGNVRPTGITYTPNAGKINASQIDLGTVGKPAASTVPKEPTTRDALIAKSVDPTVSPEERERAKTKADAIQAADTARTQAGVDVRDAKKQEADTRKGEKAFARASTMLNQTESLLDDMGKKGFMAKTPSSLSVQAAKLKRSEWSPIGQAADPTLTAWLQKSGDMVSIMRDLGDIGPRAMAAFQSTMRVIDHPTTAEGARLVFRQLREALEAYKSGKALEYEGQQPKGSGGAAPQPTQATPSGWGKAEVVR